MKKLLILVLAGGVILSLTVTPVLSTWNRTEIGRLYFSGKRGSVLITRAVCKIIFTLCQNPKNVKEKNIRIFVKARDEGTIHLNEITFTQKMDLTEWDSFVDKVKNMDERIHNLEGKD